MNLKLKFVHICRDLLMKVESLLLLTEAEEAKQQLQQRHRERSTHGRDDGREQPSVQPPSKRWPMTTG
jgi:hypothetical protein